MKELSIIIPVYNTEKYIRTCIESIFRQGLDEDHYEIIIVNDGTLDNSMGVIADIICQHENIIIINQKNQGVSVARNNGLAKARGEYILMLDPDDLLIENSLKPLLNKALSTKVDLLVADFLRMTSEEISLSRNLFLQLEKFDVTEKTGSELFLENCECYVWRTLYNRNFINSNHLVFIPGVSLQEDIPFSIESFLRATKCLRTSWRLTIYRQKREGSATNGFNLKKATDCCIAIAKTWDLIYLERLSVEDLTKIKEDTHFLVSQLIYSTLYAIKNPVDRIQVVKTLRQEAPNIKFTNGLMQRVETFLIKNSPRLYIALRERILKWHKRH